jgi:hypothetical protein
MSCIYDMASRVHRLMVVGGVRVDTIAGGHVIVGGHQHHPGPRASLPSTSTATPSKTVRGQIDVTLSLLDTFAMAIMEDRKVACLAPEA